MKNTKSIISLLTALIMALTTVIVLPVVSFADDAVASVNITVGEVPANTQADKVKDYVSVDSSSHTSVLSVDVTDENDGKVTGALQDKTEYKLVITIEADDDYYFSGDYGDFTGTVTVNGNMYFGVPKMSDTTIAVEYALQIGYVSVQTVNCIVSEPAIGTTVQSNRYATVKYTPSGAGSSKAYIYWFESDDGESFLDTMNDSDTFKKGKYYMASPDPEGPNKGYKYTSSTKFLINGASTEMGAVVFGPLGAAALKTSITGVTNKTYTGKALTQKPTVKIGTKTLKAGKDYKLSYKNNKNVGTATMIVTFIGSYKGTAKKTFKINPKSTTLTKVTAGKKSFTANWKKQATQTTGYQVQYSTSAKFKKPKTVTIKGGKNVKKVINKLTSKKKYYVRIRTYKVVNKKKYYSSWSKALNVTVK